MPTEPSKYATNQFESATAGSNPLMSEILSDTLPRLTLAAGVKPALAPALTALNTASNNWNTGETFLANAEASLLSSTAGLTDKLLSITRKPDIDTNSPIETWDSTIRSQVAYQGTIYTLLLPHGRETVTQGTIEEKLDALRDLGVRLGNQSTKPILISLGTTVTTFANAARGMRNAQQAAKAVLDAMRESQEALRIAAAVELYNMVGLGISVYKTAPDQVDTLFDVNLLRNPAQEVPAPPIDIAWNAATRTLSTTAMPAGATRLEAWREGPGGMPEQLAVGGRDALSVVIPANITFDHGDLYQFWMQARNGKGSSAAGPKVSWTAV